MCICNCIKSRAGREGGRGQRGPWSPSMEPLWFAQYGYQFSGLQTRDSHDLQVHMSTYPDVQIPTSPQVHISTMFTGSQGPQGSQVHMSIGPQSRRVAARPSTEPMLRRCRRGSPGDPAGLQEATRCRTRAAGALPTWDAALGPTPWFAFPPISPAPQSPR